MSPDNALELPQGVSQDSGSTIEIPFEPAAARHRICDKQFMDDVTQLKDLRSYMIRQAKIPGTGTIELGDLNLLTYDKKGRPATGGEWEALEHLNSGLYQHLPEHDRRRFLYGQIPQFVIRTAGGLGLIALGSLVVAVGTILQDAQFNKLWVFSCFLTWVAALGGVGSIAFIGMNALAVQEDATFDITNQKLIGLRVVLGALFAVVLTLPFGFASFQSFLFHLFDSSDQAPPSELALKSVLLLLPFILGFSTTLVILILNQFVEAVQSFFGKKSGAATAGAPVAPPLVQSLPVQPKPPICTG
jgi:hypothetical protein